MMAKSSKYVKFAFPISAYYPDVLTSGEFSEKELRKEYSRLRDIVQKRLKRMEKTEWIQSKTYKYNKDRYKKLKDIGNMSEMAHLMSDMATFLTKATGTISGLEAQREKTLDTLHEQGITGITKENWWDFTDLMDELEATKEYDPSEVTAMIKVAGYYDVSADEAMMHLDHYMAWWESTHGSSAPPKPGEVES